MIKSKKLLALALLVTILFSSFSVSYAEEKLPNAIWKLFEQEAALGNAKTKAMIDLKLQIINLFNSWPDTSQKKLEIVTPRYQYIGQTYEELKDFDNACKYYEKYAYYADLLYKKGLWNQDAYNWAINKIKNLDLEVSLYMKTDKIDNAPFFNAKYEPKAGIYFGSTYDSDSRIGSYNWSDVSKYFPKKNSAYLIYLEFGDSIKSFDSFYKAAKESGTGVQLAWNAYKTYSDMKQFDKYIKETATYLRDLNIPVFVRYGSEMNDAAGMTNAKEFVENFRYVADKLREYAPNVAIVWSPNDITASDRKLEDYYPGDEYVDWVGISTYTYYYFGNKVDWGNLQETLDNNYFTGANANPLAKVEQIVKTYGNRKPIMISESGVAHYSKVANKDMTDWALVQLARQYAYMPLRYPQIKGIFYFNVDNNITPNSIYSFDCNQRMNAKYNELVNDSIYVSNINENAPYRYAKVGEKTIVTVINDSIELSTYTIVPKVLEPKVEYVLNGNSIYTTKILPYSYKLNVNTLVEGTNKLEIKVYDDKDALIKTKAFVITKTAEGIFIEENK